MAATFAERITGGLSSAAAMGRRRTLEERSSAQGAKITIGGRALINFTSNDYLGLAAHPRVVARVREELGEHGFGSGGAALLSGRSTLHAELERALADYTGLPAALLFSSGYLANLGALTALTTAKDLILQDRLNHASLIDGVRASGARHYRYPHLDAASATAQLHAHAGAVKWIVSESVFSMDGDIAPLAALDQACADADAMLYIDDAHGFGILNQGRGAACDLKRERTPARLFMITLGKTLGAVGGAILSSAPVIAYLVQHARTFIYDTALPPVCAAAALEALAELRADPTLPKQLATRVAYFRSRAAAAGIVLTTSTTPIQPLLIGDDTRAVRIAAALLAAGFYVRAIRPPTVPAGTARLRITLTVDHAEADIDALIAALAHAVKA